MKNNGILLLAMLLVLVTGCTTTQSVTSIDRGTIGVEFTFSRENMCFGISPAITLSNIPEGTVSLRVSLRDLDHPAADHGGGTIKNLPGKVIPAGALKGYQGPCPPRSEMRRFHYVFKVEALDGNEKVLAVGQGMRECGWVDFQ